MTCLSYNRVAKAYHGVQTRNLRELRDIGTVARKTVDYHRLIGGKRGGKPVIGNLASPVYGTPRKIL